MTLQEAVDWIFATNGRWFSVEFERTRSDSGLRRMCCRLGVYKHLKGVGSYDASKKGLIRVWDRVIEETRVIPVEGIRRLKINGEWVEVNQLGDEQCTQQPSTVPDSTTTVTIPVMSSST